MQNFTLDHLSETEFEEFCYDLLSELGFCNLSWRKGTGLKNSPADRGRDIECNWIREEIDGAKVMEKWFVECKHYTQGVPPDKIQGALTWATGKSPDYLLVIASNFLSNPTKDYIEDYKQNHLPKFRIKYWEKPDLEKLTVGKTDFRRRYSLPNEYPFIDIIHPAHWAYIKTVHFSSLESLFHCLDQLDSQKRDELLGLLYELIIQPRYRQAKTSNESLLDCRLDEVSYDKFKQTCLKIVDTKVVNEFVLSFFIISVTLQYIFNVGDTTSINNALTNNREMLDVARELIECGEHEFADPEGIISFLEDKLMHLPNQITEQHKLYEYYCTHVLDKLLSESYMNCELNETINKGRSQM